MSLQHRVRDVDRQSRAIGMSLNAKKTHLFFINSKTSKQAVPFVALTDGDPLPIVSEMRLLGLVVDAELTWWPLVQDIVARARSRIWSLAKLRDVGASTSQLVSLYIARVRATIEYGAQVYGAVLNGAQAKVIEDVQTRCLQIILGKSSLSYNKNLASLELPTLEERLSSLMKDFAVATFCSPMHHWWYVPSPPPLVDMDPS